ncbi:MAG: hypothetical protein MZV49_09045 [Rhodopseudomonas palustris]|nr:hypothetical protein [Rhodopseudomonas palustris]
MLVSALAAYAHRAAAHPAPQPDHRRRCIAVGDVPADLADGAALRDHARRSACSTPTSALILPYAVLSTCRCARWCWRASSRSIPRDLENAAMIDGCTRVGALWRVVMPLAAPGRVHRRRSSPSSMPGTSSCSRCR